MVVLAWMLDYIIAIAADRRASVQQGSMLVGRDVPVGRATLCGLMAPTSAMTAKDSTADPNPIRPKQPFSIAERLTMILLSQEQLKLLSLRHHRPRSTWGTQARLALCS